MYNTAQRIQGLKKIYLLFVKRKADIMGNGTRD